MSLTLVGIVYYVQFQSLPGSFSLMLSRYIWVRLSQKIITPFTNNNLYNKKKRTSDAWFRQ